MKNLTQSLVLVATVVAVFYGLDGLVANAPVETLFALVTFGSLGFLFLMCVVTVVIFAYDDFSSYMKKKKMNKGI